MKTSTLAVLGTLFTTATALAMPNENFQGKPDFRPGEALGAWVWHDAEGQHVRFTTVDNKVSREFSGKICGGEASALAPVRLDNTDGVRIGPNGRCVVFKFTTNAGVDGFDFRMADGGDVTYELNMDGAAIPVKFIHIGAGALSPKNSPFVLNR